MNASNRLFSKGSFILTGCSIFYLVFVSILTGLRTEHWVIVFILNGMFYAGKPTRRFILGFGIFVVFAMLYDIMRAFPNYLYRPVDIMGLYNLEKAWYGIGNGAGRMTPNEYLSVHQNPLYDFLSGFFYINWIPVPLAFAVYLYFSDKRTFLNFSLTFLLVNVVGFCIYYIHPAAPPWYVKLYGFDLHLGVPGSTAELVRFDRMIHFGLFDGIYAKNANVFAAMPSLHCAYPVVVFFYTLTTRKTILIYASIVFMIGIWFAAVYSGHHYLFDVFCGILCAVAGITFYQFWLLRRNWYSRFICEYLNVIS